MKSQNKRIKFKKMFQKKIRRKIKFRKNNTLQTNFLILRKTSLKRKKINKIKRKIKKNFKRKGNKMISSKRRIKMKK